MRCSASACRPISRRWHRCQQNTVEHALTKAAQAGVADLTGDQIEETAARFATFARQSQTASTTPGAVSSFNDLVAARLTDASQRSAFAQLYFSNPASSQFWADASSLGIDPATLDALKLQGKFLYLTFNNLPLANLLQSEISELSSLPQLASKDYDFSATWQTAIENLAGGDTKTGDTKTKDVPTLDSLIPSIFVGATTADRVAAYAADLARKVRISFPTEVTARMIERGDLALSATAAPSATAFLRAASQLGYSLGRTPLNKFLARSAGQLPALDAEALESVKTLHRLFQVTPSNESLQAAVKLGFTSAHQIASIDKDDFLYRYENEFPAGEAQVIWGRGQTISSVTFNICSSAVGLDTSPPVYALSASSEQRQAAKNALAEQFPTIANLFGNVDYCECDDCSSVLSPAAYFVDVLQLLGGSTANANGYSPLDVLIGKDATVPGRRPISAPCRSAAKTPTQPCPTSISSTRSSSTSSPTATSTRTLRTTPGPPPRRTSRPSRSTSCRRCTATH